MSQPEIILAIGNRELGEKIRQVLAESGLAVSDLCASGNEALRKVRALRPELLIANYELPDTTGFEVSKIVSGNNLCSVILLTNETQRGYVEAKAYDLDIVCLNKPINKALLLNTVELVMRSRRRIRKLEKELYEMKNSLETRKTVDAAKSVLMEKLGLPEQEAYRKIQKQSMDTGVPMKDVARIIIDTMK